MGIPAAHRVGHVLAAAALASALVGLQASTATAATSSPGAPVMPSPPACANAVQVVSGTVTSVPTPLVVPVSTVGGARLSAPGLQVQTPPGTARPPVVPAAGWIVADLSTGVVLASCNAHVPFMPASTLKVLAALALRPKIDVKATYVALPADAAIDGTKVGLSPGSTYTGDDLFHGLLMSSGNDAANALADLAGGTPTATALMTEQARRLGALDTVPLNTSGLDAPGQVSSVYDLALFGRAALAEPYLARVLATRTYSFPGKGIGSGPARPRYQIQSHNRLLGSYPGTTGIKNGYTVAAGGSFIGSATRGGRGYLVAILRADGRTADMARGLLDWAFASGPATAPVGRLVSAEDVAAGRLGDPGAPGGPTGTGTTTGATTGPPVPTTGGPTPSGPVAASTTGSRPTLDAAAPTSGSASSADAWAAGLVLGAVAASGLVGGVLVVRRDRRARARARARAEAVVPGLVGERLDRLPGRADAAKPPKAFPELADDADSEPAAGSAADGGDDGPDGAPRGP